MARRSHFRLDHISRVDHPLYIYYLRKSSNIVQSHRSERYLLPSDYSFRKPSASKILGATKLFDSDTRVYVRAGHGHYDDVLKMFGWDTDGDPLVHRQQLNTSHGYRNVVIVGHSLNNEQRALHHASQIAKLNKPVTTADGRTTVQTQYWWSLWQLKSSVLIKPSQDICVPHTVSQQEVFFLHHFRANTTIKKERATLWANKIREVVSQLTDSGNEPSAKQDIYRRSKDTSRLVLEPNVSLTNEIMWLTAEWMRSTTTSLHPWIPNTLFRRGN